jgi:hypothetical protein
MLLSVTIFGFWLMVCFVVLEGALVQWVAFLFF